MLKQQFKLLCLFFILILGFPFFTKAENFGGGDGIETTDLEGYFGFNSMAIDSSGRIIVVYLIWGGVSGYDIGVVRYTPEGELDTSFGDGGMVITDMGSSEYGLSVDVDSSDRIVVAGYIYDVSDIDMILVRYTSEGKLDTSFGDEGKIITDLGDDDDDVVAEAVVIDTSDRIVVAGYIYDVSEGYLSFAVVRYTSDGELDTSFGDGGIVITDMGSTSSAKYLVINPSGKIIVGGSGSYNIIVAQYKSNGDLDTSFGGDGIVTTSIGSSYIVQSMALDTSNRIVMTDYNYLVRYKTNGDLDTSFGGDGIVSLDISGESMAIDSSGKIIVVGNICSDEDCNSAIAWYTSAGELDTSFGNGGMVVTDLGTDIYARSMALDSSARILIAGEAHGDDSGVMVARFESNGSIDGNLNAGSGGGGCSFGMSPENSFLYLIFFLPVLAILGVRKFGV